MLVVDANIILRALLGNRTRDILQTYSRDVRFVAPDYAVGEALLHLPRVIGGLARTHRLEPAILETVLEMIEIVPAEVYRPFEALARQQVHDRDSNDWPIIATAIAFDSPIWTEDKDFFGCGVATWNTRRIEIFLSRITGQT